VARDGAKTRERILDASQQLVLAHGFAATSVDDVIAAAGTTKGGFFHHFPSKQDLASALVARYAAADMALLDELSARSERLSADPLQQLLLFVGLLAEAVEEHGGDDPGCLFTTFLYERDLVDGATRATIAAAMHSWRDRTREKLERAAERYPPRIEVDLEAVADQLTTLLEGAYVLSRALDDPRLIRGQLEQFRTYLALLFAAPPLAAPSRV
jgi:TetR/AcrR family transcriptional repressor of nem operon